MKKKLIISFFIVCLLAIVAISGLYYVVWGNNIDPSKSETIFIPPDQDYFSLVDVLVDKGIIKNANTFHWTSKLMTFNDTSIKAGKYSLKNIKDNRSLIQLIRSGRQTAINVTIGSARKLDQLVNRVSREMAFDSVALSEAITEKVEASNGYFNSQTIINLFIPNTYEVYWSDSPAKFLKRMQKEYDSFWSKNDREQKAKALSLSKNEVMTLASIVEKETNYNPEKPRIAGVYLNRIKRDIPLQADPTVVYSIGDFTIKRVLNKHLEFDSPYNTYMYPGLPPGPICLAGVASIDAVLNPEEHQYLYFCAKPGYEGQHNFARYLSEHNKNARTYQNWLNKEGIR